MDRNTNVLLIPIGSAALVINNVAVIKGKPGPSAGLVLELFYCTDDLLPPKVTSE